MIIIIVIVLNFNSISIMKKFECFFKHLFRTYLKIPLPFYNKNYSKNKISLQPEISLCIKIEFISLSKNM